MKDVDVVVGIVFEGGKFLVEHRKRDEKIDPGIVCLPGGHVMPTENLEEAVKREMLKELDINVKRLNFVFKSFHVASNGERQNAYYFMITDYEGKPVCRSAQKICWENNIANLSLDVDRESIVKTRELLAKSS